MAKDINQVLLEMPKQIKKPNYKRGVFIVATIFLPLLHFCVFYIYSNASSFVMMFQRYDENNNIYWTLENFKIVIDAFKAGGIGLEAFTNTMWYFWIGIFHTLITAPVFSYFSYKNLWGDTFRRVVSAGSGLMSGVVFATIMTLYFQPGGPISAIFTSVYGLEEPAMVLADSRYANTGLIAFTLVWGIGMNYYIRGAMMRIPEDVIEYAQLDGVTWIQELTKIIMPMSWPTIMTLLVLQSTAFLTASADVFLYTNGDYGTMTISFWLWKQQLGASPESNSLNFACALGMTLSFVTIPIVFGLRWVLGRLQEKVEF